mgnify:CR=1 FL=1
MALSAHQVSSDYRWERPDYLHCQDALEFLRQLPSNSIDLVLTDPPYGISFMQGVGGWDDPDRRRINKSRLAASGSPVEIFREWVTAWALEAYRVLRPGGYLVAMGADKTHDALGWGIRLAGFEMRHTCVWVYGQGMAKTGGHIGKQFDTRAGHKIDHEIWEPITQEAKQWAGYNRALKVSTEFIYAARKPYDCALLDNLLVEGTGCLDIDAGRIPSNGPPSGWVKTGMTGRGFLGVKSFLNRSRSTKELEGFHDKGRWPPNYLLEHSPECSDECHSNCPIYLLDKLSGKDSARFFTLPGRSDEEDLLALDIGYYGRKVNGRDRQIAGYKMFKPGKSSGLGEREAGYLCKKLNLKLVTGSSAVETLGGWPIPKGASVTNYESQLVDAIAVHPTMKPINTLGRWLVRVFSPREDTVNRNVYVVDPFGGSGSFAIASLLENRTPIYNDFTEKFLAITNARLCTLNDKRPIKIDKLNARKIP